MGSISVIIPSKTRANVDACVAAVVQNEPGARIFVVDDGVDWSARTAGTNEDKFYAFEIIPGVKPFIFSRNVNIGIQAAKGDVVLLNDDALLKTKGGFSAMQKASENLQWGVIGSTCNGIGNSRQFPKKGVTGVREDALMVAFVCVFIPRRTIELVGLLDERFKAYGFEDDDYCLRVRRAGLKIGICEDCFVDHASLTSTFRGNPHHSAPLAPGKKIFIEKHGAYPL